MAEENLNDVYYQMYLGTNQEKLHLFFLDYTNPESLNNYTLMSDSLFLPKKEHPETIISNNNNEILLKAKKDKGVTLAPGMNSGSLFPFMLKFNHDEEKGNQYTAQVTLTSLDGCMEGKEPLIITDDVVMLLDYVVTPDKRTGLVENYVGILKDNTINLSDMISDSIAQCKMPLPYFEFVYAPKSEDKLFSFKSYNCKENMELDMHR